MGQEFLYQYLIQPVEPMEYHELKHKEKSILEEMLAEFDEKDKKEAEKVQVTFKYNPLRKSIGIYVGQNQLVLDDDDTLNTMEQGVVGLLHPLLERKLDRLRIYEEQWVDSLDELKDDKKSPHKSAPPTDDIPF